MTVAGGDTFSSDWRSHNTDTNVYSQHGKNIGKHLAHKRLCQVLIDLCNKCFACRTRLKRNENSAAFSSACMHEFSTPQDMTSISAVTNATHTGISTPINNVILSLMCRAYTAKCPSHIPEYVAHCTTKWCQCEESLRFYRRNKMLMPTLAFFYEQMFNTFNDFCTEFHQMVLTVYYWL